MNQKKANSNSKKKIKTASKTDSKQIPNSQQYPNALDNSTPNPQTENPVFNPIAEPQQAPDAIKMGTDMMQVLPYGLPPQMNNGWIPTQYVNNVNQLTTTPKADFLNDHFGTMKEMHFYGPQRDQRPDKKLLVNGYTSDLSNQKTVSKNQPGPVLDGEFFEKRKNFIPKEYPCLMEMAPNQKDCQGVFLCSECAAKGCIFNLGDKTCLPSNKDYPHEPYCYDNRVFKDLVISGGSCDKKSIHKLDIANPVKINEPKSSLKVKNDEVNDSNPSRNIENNKHYVSAIDESKEHKNQINIQNYPNNQNEIEHKKIDKKSESNKSSKDKFIDQTNKLDTMKPNIKENVPVNNSKYSQDKRTNVNKMIEDKDSASTNEQLILSPSDKKSDLNKEREDINAKIDSNLVEDGKHQRFVAINGYLVRQ